MSRTISYSPAYTLVPTYECFNRCAYCNFRQDIGSGSGISLLEAEQQLKKLSKTQVSEILILSGEVHPLSPQRKKWLQKILQFCELALSLGFLPHSNVGPLSWSEMKQLKKVNVSLGLMLEQLNSQSLQSIHQHSPSKDPQLRLQQLIWSGQQKIPFTTGILLGIGETAQDRQESLEAIAKVHQKWGHIQEVILQPHSLGTQQEVNLPSLELKQLPDIVAIARKLLPESITIQVPPNLIETPEILLACLASGARDLGGISPKDEVNPDYPHPTAPSLTALLEPAGWKLVPRLPVYPQYFEWLAPSLQQAIQTHTQNNFSYF